MTRINKIFTVSVIILGLASMIAATPAAAGGYHYRHGPDAGEVAGAVIGGMALGAAIGVAASQPRYYGYYGYPRGYGHGYGYGYDRYGYGW
jgi:hypothetical protein